MLMTPLRRESQRKPASLEECGGTSEEAAAEEGLVRRGSGELDDPFRPSEIGPTSLSGHCHAPIDALRTHGRCIDIGFCT